MPCAVRRRNAYHQAEALAQTELIAAEEIAVWLAHVECKWARATAPANWKQTLNPLKSKMLLLDVLANQREQSSIVLMTTDRKRSTQQ
jgi:hypothetical protein